MQKTTKLVNSKYRRRQGTLFVRTFHNEVIELTAWDVLRVAPAVVRSFEAGPEGLDLICIRGRKPKDGDTERIPDFFWD